MNTKHWSDIYTRLIKYILLGTACILLVCVIALVVLLVTPHQATTPPLDDTTQQTDNYAGDNTTQDTQSIPSSSTLYDHVILPETPDAGMAYQDKLIFVGDSLTAHMVNRGGLSGGELTQQVWHTENKMLNLNSEVTSAKIIYPATKEKMTIAEAAALAKPEIIVITLGIDWGVSYLDETDFKACYTALVKDIQKASPDTTVILQSIFPVTAQCSEARPQISNQKIDICNTWVKSIADACGCPYLDTQSVLKGEDHALPEDYNKGFDNDGIHLTEEAYTVIMNYIRTHAYTPE